MHVVVELLTAFMVWLAAAVLAQFGVDIDLEPKAPASVERLIDPRARETADPASDGCPQARGKASGGKLAAI